MTVLLRGNGVVFAVGGTAFRVVCACVAWLLVERRRQGKLSGGQAADGWSFWSEMVWNGPYHQDLCGELGSP